ncbi:MAG: two-component system sensor histidine kinase ChvG [Polaribacter sp.]|jgi:two-component system sensor histidine kinase ChvG
MSRLLVLDKINPKNWSLNKKFASLIFIIILIPFASISLLKEIEKTLVQSLQDKLSLTAKIIGSQFENHTDWFENSLLPDTKKSLSNYFYVFPLSSGFAIDGHENEWLIYEQYREIFNSKLTQSKFTQPKLTNNKTSLSVLAGSIDERLALNLRVIDDELILPSANANASLNNQFDYLEIEFRTTVNDFERIKVEPRLSGKTVVKKIIKKSKTNPLDKVDWRYKVFTKNTVNGFSVEMLFPSGVKPKELTVRYYNVVSVKNSQQLMEVDSNLTTSVGLKEIISSSQHDLNHVIWPNENFRNFVKNIKLSTAQRLWVLDSFGRVLTSNGDLDTSRMAFSSNPLLNWVLSIQSNQVIDERKFRLRLDSPAIYSALKGKAVSLIESSKKSVQAIAVATYPIKMDGKVLGILLLEENVAKVQVLQKKTLTTLFLVNLIILVGVMWLVFWYVSRLVARIKSLKNAINQTVDNHGRIKVSEENASLLTLHSTISQSAVTQGTVSSSHGDELDQLAYSFKKMGERLFEYNDYLEKLASRLSHELRTPIAIVSSSLDNLLLNEKDQEQMEIIERALHGNKRLGEIISRMKDASGIKEAMQSAVKEDTNLEDFLKLFIKGYELSYPNEKFELIIDAKQCKYKISKDLFAEMLDKLISNAVSFSDKKQSIKISLEQNEQSYQLKISNSGDSIKKKNLTRIFRSLVSIRDKSSDSNGANLGLGLYVVKLIADFHQAKVKAENLSDASGVVFILSW